ncbi:hypothetical protein [Ilyobacter polytropus]|uniref:Uncharacterized protein n=1 Tax=Ilyobacter polytropus (strain ATCC 51220 / DSM 2926 / LMG 16218 / CuHBu1) TaxID=572544 RepID=E3HBP7_ILYPC|nr:hypothetical protein [Ilyobacter polytropus]ADO83809.1 hypothetical protein Ilyop_2038 [Ilyobacter polytropus DSM 2926]
MLETIKAIKTYIQTGIKSTAMTIIDTSFAVSAWKMNSAGEMIAKEHWSLDNEDLATATADDFTLRHSVDMSYTSDLSSTVISKIYVEIDVEKNPNKLIPSTLQAELDLL